MGTGNLEVVGVVTAWLAHMGGIDEIGIFLIPALLAIYVLKRAERQARKRAEADADSVARGEGGSVAADDGSGTEFIPPI